MHRFSQKKVEENMMGQGGYGGSNFNPLVASQMKHIATQIMQHSLGMHAFPGRPHAPPLDEEQHYMSSKA